MNDGIRALAVAVLERAIRDATVGDVTPPSRELYERYLAKPGKRRKKRYAIWATWRNQRCYRVYSERKPAMDWLSGADDPENTFGLFCDVLGVDPDRTRAGILERIKEAA
jgi:hypothetical protein